MRKLFSLALMLVMISGFSVCQASISADRMSAGGVYIGQKIADVIAIYGRPVSIETKQCIAPFTHTEYTYKYGQYGTTFDVVASGKSAATGNVIYIKVSGNNGISTKDGIKVGTSVSEMKRILGKPSGETKERIHYNESDNTDFSNSMLFFIRNGVIVSYSLLSSWM